MANNSNGTEQSRRQVIRFDVLPDDVLLDIFDFCVNIPPSDKRMAEAWQLLIHVCRRWRSLVFLSPRRLNLRLFCTPKTPARDKLDVWPALPLLVDGNMAVTSGADNIIAALERSNRVHRVMLSYLQNWKLKKVLAAMQVPFPELTDLHLSSYEETPLVIPDSFLGGSASHLLYFLLDNIPFPGLPNLLLSATHLVNLRIYHIPDSGYISPEVMASSLSVLSSLESLHIEFEIPPSRPVSDTRRPPPKRSILPVLKDFQFDGVYEYLEGFVSLIDTPQLETSEMTFLDHIDLDTQQLAQFINRTPQLSKHDEAQVRFKYDSTGVLFGTLGTSFTCGKPDRQLLSVVQVCNSLHPLSTIKDLYVGQRHSRLVWKNDAIDNTLWLQLLLPFTAVENLYVSKELVLGIAAALYELVGGRITEVLPSLQNIFLEELEPSRPKPFQEHIIGQFVAARQLSGHPIAISDW